jgi:hypothetical protein
MRIWRYILTRVALRTRASLYVIIFTIEVIELPNLILEVYWWGRSDHLIFVLGNYFLFRRLFLILVNWFLATNISCLCLCLFRSLRILSFTFKKWCTNCILGMLMRFFRSCFLTCDHFYIIIFFCRIFEYFSFFSSMSYPLLLFMLLFFLEDK